MKNPLMLAAVFGLLSSSAAFAIDDGKLNLICTVRHSLKIPMLKSPSSRTITGAVENNEVVTLLEDRGMARIRKNGGTTGWISLNFLDCSTSYLQMPEPLQGKWCPDPDGLGFFMNWPRDRRNYSPCNESGQPELLVLSDGVQIDRSPCRPIQVTKFDVCLTGHGHTMGVDDNRLGYHVKLRCNGWYPAHDWIVGWIVGGKESLEVGPKRERVLCPREQSLEPWDEGWTASQAGKPRDANPYSAGSRPFQRWDAGWRAHKTAASNPVEQHPVEQHPVEQYPVEQHVPPGWLEKLKRERTPTATPR